MSCHPLHVLVTGPDGASRSHGLDGDLIVVGRSGRSGLVLLDPAVSREHVRLVRDGKAWRVDDAGGRNGFMLNGKRVMRSAVVEAGDEVRVGRTMLSILADGCAAGAAATGLAWSSRGEAPARRARELVGEAAPMRAVRGLVDKLGPKDGPVLVTGEPGTGRQSVARRLHDLSPRRNGPFVLVDCRAVPPALIEVELFGLEKGGGQGVEARVGRMETADGGTLFLHEAGELGPVVRAKLSKYLDDGQVERVGGSRKRLNVRLIASTSGALQRREDAPADLLHRMLAAEIALPPLSERPGDLKLLFSSFVAVKGKSAVTDAAWDWLGRQALPGNVRELRELADRARAAAGSGEIDEPHLKQSCGETATTTAKAPKPRKAAAR